MFLIIAIICFIIVGLMVNGDGYPSDGERAVARTFLYVGLFSLAVTLLTVGSNSDNYAAKRLANSYNVSVADVEIRDQIEMACTRSRCWSWQGVGYVYGQRVGIVLYNYEGNYQFTPDDPEFVPVKPPVPPAPYAEIGLDGQQVSLLVTQQSGVTQEEALALLAKYETANEVILAEEAKTAISSFVANYYGFAYQDMYVILTPEEPLMYAYFVQTHMYYNAYDSIDGDALIVILPEAIE